MREITRKATGNDYIQIAKSHREYIKTGFLSTLGLSFLKLLYKSMITSKYAFCIVTQDNGNITGFASATINVDIFYKEFFSRNFFQASTILFPKFLNPKFTRRIVESLFYPAKIRRGLPNGDLLSIVVDKNYRGSGASQKLFKKVVEEFRKRGIKRFKVVAGSNLAAACRFYEKMGGILHSEIEVHRGKKSRVYVWKI